MSANARKPASLTTVSLAVNFRMKATLPSILVLITPSAAVPAFRRFDSAGLYACFRLPAQCRHSLPVSAFAIHHACAGTLRGSLPEG
ncbi:hypothetical protein KCP69_23960 [Salmonella enterica subsp. enterica]|nr:hypothetical protein KCP69_23960 [Salmonella enterica subsp. enterica]